MPFVDGVAPPVLLWPCSRSFLLAESEASRCAILAASAALLFSTASFAQAADKPKSALDAAHAEVMIDQAKTAYADAPVEERAVTTRQSASVDGRDFPYTATAGTLTIRDVAGKPDGEHFLHCLYADGAASSRRPVMFFYNGGPGSASLWLRMGSFGPMRLQTGNPETIRPAPFGFGANPDSLLGVTDMVFLDAPGTGYSRPLGDAKGSGFLRRRPGRRRVRQGDHPLRDQFDRWSSPKFLFGESYGTTRSGALAYQLQDRGMALNGVVLLSSIMNYGRRQPGLDRDLSELHPELCRDRLVSSQDGQSAGDGRGGRGARPRFRAGPYAVALEKGQTIAPAESQAIAQQMAGITGLSPDFILRCEPPRRPVALSQGVDAQRAPDRRTL